MHFGTKSYLKSNRYHTAKHVTVSLFLRGGVVSAIFGINTICDALFVCITR
jgi:hypothetical protein